MRSIRTLLLALCTLLLLWFSSGAALAQEEKPQPTSTSAPIVTGALTGSTIRFTAPGSITTISLEIYSSAGERVFDSGMRDGNILDWRWQSEKDQLPPLGQGSYLGVITVKSLSSRTSRKLVTVSVDNQQATLKPIATDQIAATQVQALSITDSDTP